MRPIIKRIVDSNIFVLALMLALGMLQFGWVFFPALGTINIILTGVLFFGAIILGFYRRKTKWGIRDKP